MATFLKFHVNEDVSLSLRHQNSTSIEGGEELELVFCYGTLTQSTVTEVDMWFYIVNCRKCCDLLLLIPTLVRNMWTAFPFTSMKIIFSTSHLLLFPRDYICGMHQNKQICLLEFRFQGNALWQIFTWLLLKSVVKFRCSKISKKTFSLYCQIKASRLFQRHLEQQWCSTTSKWTPVIFSTCRWRRIHI